MPLLTGSKLEIVKKIVVYDGGAAYPGVAAAKNGDLLVSFRTAVELGPGGPGDLVPGAECFLTRSIDNGETWSHPRLMAKPRRKGWACSLSVGLHVLSDGTVLYPFYEGHDVTDVDREGILYCYRSTDNGQTWTNKDPIPCGLREPFAYGRIVELSDRILLPLWGSRVKGERWRTGLLMSFDNGKTWPEYRTIAVDPDFKAWGR